MNKDLLAVAIFPVDVNGSITDPFESERDIAIITDSSVYRFADELKIKVNFNNDLSKDIRIVNDNCEVPVFILEKKIEEIWERVYLSDCLGLPVHFFSPTLLQSKQAFNAEIFIYTPDVQDENIAGEYRLSFNLIEKESNKRLPEKYLYSNVFKIINEI
jgi:hypothetical protein